MADKARSSIYNAATSAHATVKGLARGGGLPYVDKALSNATWTMGIGTPSKDWPRDPRRRSKNLGRVVDGVFGAAGDIGSRIPVVWPVTGFAAKGAAEVVRLAEDLVNAITGTFGVQLFVIAMLSALACPVTGEPSRTCRLSNGTNIVTNVCSQQDIHYCTPTSCWHEAGCFIADEDGCWPAVTLVMSHHPNASNDITQLSYHLNVFTLVMYGCELSGWGEVCGMATVALDFVYTYRTIAITIVCNHTCGSDVVSPDLTRSWFAFFWAEQTVAEIILEAIGGLPWLLNVLMTTGHIAVLFVCIAYVVDGRWPRTVVLLILFTLMHSARVGADSQYNDTTRCRKYTNLTTSYECWVPYHFLPVARKVASANDTSEYRLKWDFRGHRGICRVWTHGHRLQFKLVWSGSYVHVSADTNNVNCSLGVQPCATRGDGFRRRRKDTLARCHYGPQLAPCVWVTNNRYPDSYAQLGRTTMPVDCTCRFDRVTRHPGNPVMRDTKTIYNCPGHAILMGDNAKGLVVFDAGGHQVVAGLSPVSSVIVLEHTIFIFLTLQFMGAKVTGLVYLLILCATTEAAVPWQLPAAMATAGVAEARPWLAVVSLWVVIYGNNTMAALVAIANSVRSLGWFVFLCAGWCMTNNTVAGLSYPDVARAVSSPEVGFTLLVAALAALAILPVRQVRRYRMALAWHVEYIQLLIQAAMGSGPTNPLPAVLVPLTCVAAYATEPCFLSEAVFWLLVITISADLAFKAVMTILVPIRQERLVDGLSALIMLLPNALAACIGSVLVLALDRHKIFLYHHLGELGGHVRALAELVGAAVDPFTFPRDHVVYIQDNARRYACKDVVNGLPVVARREGTILLGVPRSGLPPGYQLCTPLVTTVHSENTMMRVLGVSITGSDSRLAVGHVAIVRSLMSRSMGYACDGIFHTAYHGTKARTIASHDGPLAAIAYNSELDVCTYPCPQGMTCLEACGCNDEVAYLVNHLGGTNRAAKVSDDIYRLARPVEMSVLRGSSGAPLLCARGHVVATFVAAGVCKGVGVTLKVVPYGADITKVGTTVVAPYAAGSAPLVPSKYEVQSLVAPTGSGKSTALPMEYVTKGRNVLVLNPSVATTSSMGGYMYNRYKVTPNVHFGDTSIVTGSRLTYATYGKFMARGPAALTGVDVVICDECHSTDTTTVLGMSMVLALAEQAGVKLVLLATATPPGCPVTPHPLIQEVELPDKGDIPFYGKALEVSRYVRGRHLIFCDTKKRCSEIAAELRLRKVVVLTYWRGCDPKSIPVAGDVVVVATNALMTGYTGNFDSVTDCCSEVVPTLDVSFEPTITAGVRSAMTTPVTRMQRRGRTGRGKQGLYLYTYKGTERHGSVPSASVWEAYDVAAAWYGLSPAMTSLRLRYYKNQPALPSIRDDLEVIEAFFSEVMTSMNTPEVAQMKTREVSFPLLSGFQIAYCRRMNLPLPACERFANVGVPMSADGLALYALDGPIQTYSTESTQVATLRAALGVTYEDSSSFVLGMAGVVTLAGVAVLLDMMGSIVVDTTFLVGDATANPSKYEESYFAEGFINMSTDYGMGAAMERAGPVLKALQTKLGVCAATVAATAKTAAAKVGLVAADPSMQQKIADTLHQYAHPIAGAIQAAGGLAILASSPLMGASLLGAGFYMLNGTVAQKLYMSLMAGALGTWMSNPVGGLAACAGAAAGALVGATGIGSLMLEVLVGYSATTSAALLMFRMLQGEVPSVPEVISGITCIMSPGAAAAGVVLSLVLWKALGHSSATWLNRMLAMCVKGNVLPANYFDETTDQRTKMCEILRVLTPAALIDAASSWSKATEVVQCDSHWFIQTLVDLIMGFFRTIIAGWKAATDVTPNIPLLTCSKPYRGAVSGTGSVNTVCPCGNSISYVIEAGVVMKKSSASNLCRAAWSSGVLILRNSCSKGRLFFRPDKPFTGVYPIGINDAALVRVDRGTYTVLETTSETIRLPSQMPSHVGAYITVNGWNTPNVCTNLRYPMRWRSGACVAINGTDVSLPHVTREYAQVGKSVLDHHTQEIEEDLLAMAYGAWDDKSSTAMAASKARQMAKADIVPSTVSQEETYYTPMWGGPERSPSTIEIERAEVLTAISAKTTAVVARRKELEQQRLAAAEARAAMIRSMNAECDRMDAARDEMEALHERGKLLESRQGWRDAPRPKGVAVFETAWSQTSDVQLAAKLMASDAIPPCETDVMSQQIADSLLALRCEGRASDLVGGLTAETIDEMVRDTEILPGSGEIDALLEEPKLEASGAVVPSLPEPLTAVIQEELAETRAALPMEDPTPWLEWPNDAPIFDVRSNKEKDLATVRFRENLLLLGGDVKRALLDGDLMAVCCAATYMTDTIVEAAYYCADKPDITILSPLSRLTVERLAGAMTYWLNFFSHTAPNMTCVSRDEARPEPHREPSVTFGDVTFAKEGDMARHVPTLVEAKAAFGGAWAKWGDGHLTPDGSSICARREDIEMRRMEHPTAASDVSYDSRSLPSTPAGSLVDDATAVAAMAQDRHPSDGRGPSLPMTALAYESSEGGPHMEPGASPVCAGPRTQRTSRTTWDTSFCDPAFWEVVKDNAVIAGAHTANVVVSGDTAKPDTWGLPPPPETFELASHSYIWNGAPLVRAMRRTFLNAVAGASYYFGTNRGLVYATDPLMAGERAKKVTMWRNPVPASQHYADAVAEAMTKARQTKVWRMSLEDAVQAVPNASAKSAETGLTPLDLKAGKGKAGIWAAYDAVTKAKDMYKWCYTTLHPKLEWFVKVPTRNYTKKPPRFIMYPPLETRVVEKMLLGDVAPNVVKAVLGESYGFDKTPEGRAEHIVRWWHQMRNPMCFAADGLVFDSQVTPHDMRTEATIFGAPADKQHAADIMALTNNLYAQSPIRRHDGTVVGLRQCRASGVYTTSAGNCLTSWLKMTAAMRAAGVKNPKMMVCGDDCFVVCESTVPHEDSDLLLRLTRELAKLGLVQAAPIVAGYSLEAVSTCSAYITAAKTTEGVDRYFLSQDPVRVLGRCMVESEEKSAICTWTSYIIAQYPTLYTSRVVAVGLVEALLSQTHVGQDATLTFEYNGNTFTIPTESLPQILEHLHGPDVFKIARYSAKHVYETVEALKYLGFEPLRMWKKRAILTWRRAQTSTRAIRELARTLLWWAVKVPTHSKPPSPSERDMAFGIQLADIEPWGRREYVYRENVRPQKYAIGLLLLLMIGAVKVLGLWALLAH